MRAASRKVTEEKGPVPSPVCRLGRVRRTSTWAKLTCIFITCWKWDSSRRDWSMMRLETMVKNMRFATEFPAAGMARSAERAMEKRVW